MNELHPVIPPQHLLNKWRKLHQTGTGLNEILIEAAQYGADIELEECCKQFESNPVCGTKFQRSSSVNQLRKKRRPQTNEVSFTLSVKGTHEQIEQLIYKLKHDQQITVEL